MTGSHPTTQRITGWQALLLVPAMALLVTGFLVSAVFAYAAETVRDIRPK